MKLWKCLKFRLLCFLSLKISSSLRIHPIAISYSQLTEVVDIIVTQMFEKDVTTASLISSDSSASKDFINSMLSKGENLSKVAFRQELTANVATSTGDR